MGWLTDLLKEIPLSAVLKEKIADIEARHAATETENAILKDDLHEAKTEIDKLKKQLEKLTHKDDPLDEIDVKILQMIALYTTAPSAVLANEMGVHYQVIELHTNTLAKNGYIRGFDLDGFWHYRLCDKARRFLIDNDLLPPRTPY